MRTHQKHNFEDIETFKSKLLTWSQQFESVLYLDSNNYEQLYSSYDAIIAVDAFTSIQTDYNNGFEKLKDYYKTTNDWIFGYLTYDLKNDVEVLNSHNFDGLAFPDMYFFQPKKLFLIKGNTLETRYLKVVDGELESDLKTILDHIKCASEFGRTTTENPIKIKLRIHKDDYFEKVNTMLSHIKRGDIYEANFCQEFYAEDTKIDPLAVYCRLNAISTPPFATFFRLRDKYLLSASPERYLKKENDTIISQPIKGTAKRDQNKKRDASLKSNLEKDKKERSENIMIVDLVRNDLSKTALKGSIKVEELCKVYSFDQVHQMISTVTSKVDKKINPVEVLKTTFPMGSMTGAPKVSAMQIIEDLEETKRGLYSGTVGYFTPNGDFDFNVVIRSILYNEKRQYVSYSVGGAITAKSVPLKEYEECLIKAKAMRDVLEN